MPAAAHLSAPAAFPAGRRFFAGIKRAALVWREPFIGGAALFSKTGCGAFLRKSGAVLLRGAAVCICGAGQGTADRAAGRL